ncbi:MAG: sigma-54-dependent transcriptional regulator [Myxococcales bacterium]|nr:sigma-54 dependent transcriptional regulator [Myxococcales bacterium]
MSRRILLVDDDPAVLRGVGGLLRDEGYRTETAATAAEAHAALTRDPPAAVILDLGLPDESGLALLGRLPRPLPSPIVVLSGGATPGEAAQALKLGATDFVEKPPTAERLLTALQNALALRDLEDERERLREELAQPGNLIGESAEMAEVRKLVARAGPSDSVVLIQGETGTGKERVARALHLASGRKGRFVAVNCAAIPAQLLESELFGAEKGAYTGATARRIGRFEQAQLGTLLLDEIGELPLELQAKLLRVLEQREVERLGGSAPVRIDVRVVAATHRDLRKAVADQRFREDLYYRLAVFPVRVPPLRDRTLDIIPLARAFTADLRGAKGELRLTAQGENALRAHPWPGNVRELRNFVERLHLLRDPGPLVVDEDAARLLAPAAAKSAVDGLGALSYRELCEEAEKTILREALARSGGNVAAAARLLKVDRGNLYRRIKALGVEVSE